MTVNDASRRMPVRTRRVDLDGDFAGWWIEIRTNVPMGVLLDMETGRVASVLEALGKLTIASNYVDDDGAPIDLTTPDGWRKIGMDLINVTMAAVRTALKAPFETGTTPSSSVASPTAAESPSTTPS